MVYCYITMGKGDAVVTFSITRPAVELYKNEMDLNSGDALKFFVRYAGSGDSGGFSLGVELGIPSKEDYIQEVEGILFYVKPDDQWLVDEMFLDYDEKSDQFTCYLPSIA
jgi:uncharacterized protein YneR